MDADLSVCVGRVGHSQIGGLDSSFLLAFALSDVASAQGEAVALSDALVAGLR